ncbi:MAG TPA: NAD(P)/FAD-dependent oxidoreductase, partial [Myxococcaceae bacterium]|nr:NAD(P)/FAD-dependent oxidoreductase [Myxococcaceae bacterium]
MKKSLSIAIIGSGFSGLCMGIRLKQAGIHSFTLLERADSVGGTWRDNTYPGAACDVPSPLYSFSFEPNPRWSRLFAPQAEIRAYLEHCTDKYGQRPHIRFNTPVTSARIDEQESQWLLKLGDGEELRADLVVLGTGGLSRPSYPDIPGLGDFQGRVFHSARWEHDYDFTGKRVAVIGSGASAIQLVPEIAPRVERLHIFQRTPPWILPREDRTIGRLEQKLYQALPLAQRLHRQAIYWLLESRVLALTVNPRLTRLVQREAIQFLEHSIPEPELRKKLTPDYMLGCKRVLLSNDYYPTLLRPNVELVTDGIRRLSRTGVLTKDGTERPVDALVLATGFQAAEEVAPFEIKGRGGVELQEAWREGAEAYLGTTVA